MKKTDKLKRHRSPDKAIPSSQSKNCNGKKHTQSPKRIRMSQSSTPANGMVASSRTQTGPRKITIKKLRCQLHIYYIEQLITYCMYYL